MRANQLCGRRRLPIFKTHSAYCRSLRWQVVPFSGNVNSIRHWNLLINTVGIIRQLPDRATSNPNSRYWNYQSVHLDNSVAGCAAADVLHTKKRTNNESVVYLNQRRRLWADRHAQVLRIAYLQDDWELPFSQLHSPGWSLDLKSLIRFVHGRQQQDWKL